MIAGELEHALNYDSFIFGKNSNIGQKLQKLGQKIDKAGGLAGIGETVDNVRSLFRKSDPAPAAPSDYQISLAQPAATITNQIIPSNDKKEEEKKKKEKLIIISVAVVGGIVIMGLVLWHLKKRKQQPVVIVNKPA